MAFLSVVTWWQWNRAVSIADPGILRFKEKSNRSSSVYVANWGSLSTRTGGHAEKGWSLMFVRVAVYAKPVNGVSPSELVFSPNTLYDEQHAKLK